jgi:hypothetical protein
MHTHTRTYVILDLSAAAFDEIKAKLTAASYAHAFSQDAERGLVIDMNGLAVAVEKDERPGLNEYQV